MRVCLWGVGIGVLLAVIGGCSAIKRAEEEPTRLFVAADMRIHPIFTQVRDWTGDGEPDGIEVLLEFRDAFADLTKAAGTAVFELYEYRPYNSDPRGRRLAEPWVGPLLTADQQRAHWSAIPRTYTFRLDYDAVRTDRPYVLGASFDLVGGERLFDQIVLEEVAPREAPPREAAPRATAPVAPPTTAPSAPQQETPDVQPATAPAGI